MLLVAPHERKVRIPVGRGLEGTLTDEICSDIIKTNILPHFRTGDYSRGIEDGASELQRRIEKRGEME